MALYSTHILHHMKKNPKKTKQSDQYVQIFLKLVNNSSGGLDIIWTVFLILLWMVWMIVDFGVLDWVRGGNAPLRQPKGEKQREA